MNYLTPAVILLSVALIVFTLMWLGWRARHRAQRHLAEPDAALTGELEAATRILPSAHYVATTPSDAPLERIVVGGLGFRGRCALAVNDRGVLIGIRGESPFVIPWGALRSLELGTATIDRVVEREGLTVLRWQLGKDDAAKVVDTSLRIVNPDDRATFHQWVEDGLAAHTASSTSAAAHEQELS